MKKVFDNRMTAHVWAQQCQPEGRSHNGNLFFDGRTIYSYGRHFAIARFETAANGERGVLMTTRSYSVSTSQHCTLTRLALRNNPRVIYVADVPPYDNVPVDHHKNIACYRSEYAERVIKGSRARLHGQWHLDKAEQMRRQLAEYVEFFALADIEPLPEVTGEQVERVKAATLKAQAEQTAATKAKQLRDCAEWAAGELYHLSPAAERHLTDDQRAQRKGVEDNAATLWRAGNVARNIIPGRTRMRVEGDEIVTSQGARFPVSHGVLAWALVKRCNAKCEGWKPNGHKIHLGHFQVDEITPEGHVKAGCHFVEFEEVRLTAVTLGLEEG